MPNYIKTIMCLANSRKISGRCIAGREFTDEQIGDWVRPVSARENAELSEEERRFENGRDPRVLDIIQIPMIEPKPHSFQIENHLIDAGYYWSLKGIATWQQALTAVDRTEGPLWSNNSRSYNGLNDRVAEYETSLTDGSLRLIEVQNLEIEVALEGEDFGNGKRKVRGKFSFSGINYCLAITDPPIERKFLQGQNGVFPIGHALLCISLGEPYHGYAYKLIAAVILPQ